MDTRPRNRRPRSDRSRSPSTRDRTATNDRRRDRSPIQALDRQPQRPTGPGRNAPRGRDGAAQQHPRNGDRRPPTVRAANTNHNTQASHKAKEPVTILEMLKGEDQGTYINRIMGFGDFRSTKNTKVPGNDRNYGVSKVKKTEYRQYMNRTGGFNRPLSPSRK